MQHAASGNACFRRYSLVYELTRSAAARFGSDLLAELLLLRPSRIPRSIVVLMPPAARRWKPRVAECIFGFARLGETNARHCPSEKRFCNHRRALMKPVGDTLVVYPHDICPVDGTVIDGHGVMNEAFLTGEPFEITGTRF